jgi:folate-binding protein YgfZ
MSSSFPTSDPVPEPPSPLPSPLPALTAAGASAGSDAFSAWAEWATRETFCCPLPPRTRFLLQGPDAFRYLNGQSSNDLARVSDSQSLPTCLLTVKGRVVAVPQVWRAGEDAFLLEVPESMAEATAARLDRYLVADEVEITSAPAPGGWHISGAHSAVKLPAGSRDCTRFVQPGADFDSADIPGVADSMPRLSLEEAEALRVLLGLPGEPEWLAEVFPAEIGLDRTAVDFHKGCYPGQEVVSRLESVGQARRTLVRWMAKEAPAVPLAGSGLRQTPDGRDLGLITSTVAWPSTVASGPGPTSLVFGLALVRVEVVEKNSPSPLLFALPENAPAVEIQLIV